MSIYDIQRRLPDALRLHLPIEYQMPPLLLASWMILRQRALQTAELRKDIPDYIVLEWVNKGERIDSQAEAEAAEITAFMLRNIKPNVVLAIGNSGLSFGRAINTVLIGAQYFEAKKYDGEPNVVNGNLTKAHSYSLDRDMWFEIPDLPDGARVVIADDVIAHGNVGFAIGNGVRDQGRGIELVGIGSYFAKVFQGGEERLRKEFGVPCFSVIRIQDIYSANGKRSIALTPERPALKI